MTCSRDRSGSGSTTRQAVSGVRFGSSAATILRSCLACFLALDVQQTDTALGQVVDFAQPHLVERQFDQPPLGQAAILGEHEMDPDR